MRHERTVNAGMADPECGCVIETSQSRPDPFLEHGDAFAAMGAGVEKVVGPCVERMAVNVIPTRVFPCAKVHFDQIVVGFCFDLSLMSKGLRQDLASRQRAADDPCDVGESLIEALDDCIETGGQFEVGATIAETVGGVGFAVAQEDQRHARKTSGIRVSVSCSQAPSASPV